MQGVHSDTSCSITHVLLFSPYHFLSFLLLITSPAPFLGTIQINDFVLLCFLSLKLKGSNGYPCSTWTAESCVLFNCIWISLTSNHALLFTVVLTEPVLSHSLTQLSSLGIWVHDSWIRSPWERLEQVAWKATWGVWVPLKGNGMGRSSKDGEWVRHLWDSRRRLHSAPKYWVLSFRAPSHYSHHSG